MTVRSVIESSLGLDGRTRSIVEQSKKLQLSVQYLVVGGGGSGAYALNGISAGGGGAGGYRCNVTGENSGGGASAESSFVAVKNFPYSLIVGAGGAGVGPSTNSLNSNNGSDSFFGLVQSFGGGFATTGLVNSQSFGGSGGGAGSNANNARPGGLSITNQGFNGGDNHPTATAADRAGGGGGGAGAVGANAALDVGGNGGNGVASSITGSSVTRGGGGGGCTSQQSNGTQGSGGTGGGAAGRIGDNNGFSGTANTGGGGGALSVFTTNTRTSGNGGSGVIILKYSDIFTATFSAGVTQSTSTSGGFKISTITATSTTSETVTFA